MKFLVSHNVLYRTTVDAANQKEADALASAIPYDQWESSAVTREDIVPLEESPINPQAGG